MSERGWKKGRRTCYRADDIKMICPSCGQRNFVGRIGLPVEVKLLTIVCWQCSHEHIADLTEHREMYGHAPKPKIFDLIYTKEVMADLQKMYPDAKYEDASDGFHGDRFTIEMEGVEKRDYIKSLIGPHGAFEVSFIFQMTRIDNPEMIVEILEELDQNKTRFIHG